MRSTRIIALLPFVLASTGRAESAPQVMSEPPKPHAIEAARHVGRTPILQRMNFARPKSAIPRGDFKKVVYGYLPYWSETASVPWAHLTHLSYFSVELNQDGSLGTDHGWSENGANLVALGQSWGVEVTLTATLFDNNKIGTLLSSPTTRQTAINNLLARVQLAGGRGINIDFEYVPLSAKANFVTFMTDLAAAFHAAIPGSHVSLATPQVDWAGSYDYDALAEATDGLMIMAYGYHYAGGPPGPLSPVGEYVSQANFSNPPVTTWGKYTLFWTAADYIKWGKWENRHKFIMGYPLYGHIWPTASSAVPGQRHHSTGEAGGPKTSTPRFDGCQTVLSERGEQWDEDSATPYAVYQEGGYWRQMFCENTRSLEAKFDLINHENIDFGGVMFWALGYAEPNAAVWTKLDQHFKYPPVANVAPVASALAPERVNVGTQVTLDGSDSADGNGDVLTFAWTQLDGPTVQITGAAQAIATVTLAEAGLYRFKLTVSDGEASASANVQIEAVNEPEPGPIGGGGDSEEPQSEEPFPNSNASRRPIERQGCAATGASSLAPWVAWLLIVGRRRGLSALFRS